MAIVVLAMQAGCGDAGRPAVSISPGSRAPESPETGDWIGKQRIDPTTADLLKALPDGIREPLEASLASHLHSTRTMTPSEWVEEMSIVLSGAGLPDAEIAAVLGGLLERGLFSVGDRIEAVRTLGATYPDDDALQTWISRLPIDGDAPEGSIMVSIRESAGDPCELDGLSWARLERRDAGWAPEHPWDIPVKASLWIASIDGNRPGIGAEDRFLVSGTLSATDGAGMTVWRKPIEGDFDTSASHRKIDLSLQGPEDLPGGPLDLIFEYVFTQESPSGADGVPPSRRSFHSRFRARLEPVAEATTVVGYREVPYGLGRRLSKPELVSAAVLDAMSFYFATPDVARAPIEKARMTADRHASLIGTQFETLVLAHPASDGGTTLAVPSHGDAVIFFGATWCQPCHEIAPRIRDWVESLRGRPDAPRVFRIAVDTDEDRYARAVAGDYPDGVIAPDDQTRLAIDAVPMFVVVRQGRLAEIGVTGPHTIERFRSGSP